MTIIEYAEKLGYKLNSAQMMLLNKMQEAKEHDLQLFICCPPRMGKMTIADIVEKYNK
ncbi:MAG: hypothetical protein ACLS47_00845 [Clostridium sp.]|jgi:hypothetical protein